MARIRSVKPEFWADELVSSWPFVSRLAYIALWNEADDDGRLRANPSYLRSALFPYDEKMNMKAVLKPIADAGRLLIYVVDGQTFGFLPHFREHQVINRPMPSKLPPPPEPDDSGDSGSAQGALTESSVKAPGVVTDDSPGKGREQGREGKGAGMVAGAKPAEAGQPRDEKSGSAPPPVGGPPAYRAAWRERYGCDPRPSRADAIAANQALRPFPPDQREAILRAFVADDDPWLVKMAHRLGLLASQLDRIRAGLNGSFQRTPADAQAAYEDLLRRELEAHP